jgi:hypothetical protein
LTLAVSGTVKGTGIGVDCLEEITLWQYALTTLGEISFMGVVDIVLLVTLGCVFTSEEHFIGC